MLFRSANLCPWDYFNRIPTTGVADGVFKGNRTLDTFAVCCNDEFATIGAEAFQGSSVRVVDLFDSVTTIGPRAFADCDQLAEITLPASVTEVGESAFANCAALKSVTILGDASVLPADAFAGCPALESVYVASGVLADGLFGELPPEAASFGPGVTEVNKLAFAAAAPTAMPDEPTDAALFDFDAETGAILRYKGTEIDVVIPREINGAPVRQDRKSTRLNSSHPTTSRMPSSA